MNISVSQSQLLRQLNIRPLQARSGFFNQLDTSAANLTIASDTVGLLQPEATVLSSDIKLLLTQSVITDWQIDPDATQCQLTNNNILITPTLATLQQPCLKQQLWLLLQPLLADDAD